MATVLRRDKKPLAVKNLGWLLRHWKEVESLSFNYSPDNASRTDGELIANLKDGGTCLTTYASLSVCWDWLLRPVFIGRLLYVVQLSGNYDRTFTIGNEEYRRLNSLPYEEFFRTLGLTK